MESSQAKAVKTLMASIRNNRGDMTLECTTTRVTKREYYEQLHYQKADNVVKWTRSLKDSMYQGS